MSTPDLATLRDALAAARPAMTGEQQDAADALLAALTPPMEEPAVFPSWVMAGCRDRRDAHLHQRTLDPSPWWECTTDSWRWRRLIHPRPLTPGERAEYGIPSECEQPHAEPISDELVERCAEAADDSIQEDWLWPDLTRAILRAAGHPEADR